MELKQARQEVALTERNMQELREKVAESGNDMKMLGAKDEARAHLIEQLQKENDMLRERKCELDRRLKELEIEKLAIETRAAEVEKQSERN